ncbi:Protein saal1 [Glycine max]|nr:Protein saal1 [Glycine max]
MMYTRSSEEKKKWYQRLSLTLGRLMKAGTRTEQGAWRFRQNPIIEEEEEIEQGGPMHHPSAPSHELLPLDSASRSSLSEVASLGPNQEGEEEGASPSASVSSDENVKSSKNKSENMDVDVSAEFSRGECQDTGDGIEHSGVSVGEDAWEEYGCILWDLAASKTHAELMVENLILEVLLANLLVCKSERVTEIGIGIIGNLACHEVPMKHIISTKGLIEIIVEKLLLTVGLQSGESITWAEALQSEHILCQILWIAENTLNLQLLVKIIGLILAILESHQKVVDALLPPMMKLGLANILISLLTFEIRKLMTERIPKAHSVMDDHSQEICSSTELFQLICDLVKFPDKFEVGNCCGTAAVLIANMLSDVADHALKISQAQKDHQYSESVDC